MVEKEFRTVSSNAKVHIPSILIPSQMIYDKVDGYISGISRNERTILRHGEENLAFHMFCNLAIQTLWGILRTGEAKGL